MFNFLKKTNNLKSIRLVNIIPTTSSDSFDTCFQEIKQDLDSFLQCCEDLDSKILMPLLYAYRLATAGLYHQGLLSKEDFDLSDQAHFNLMVTVGSNITKQEQIDFQENSLEHSMEFFRIYYPSFKKIVGSALIVSAKNDVSIFQALLQALNKKLKDDALSNEICSLLVTPQFCTAFVSLWDWDPVNDSLSITSQKIWGYFKARHYHTYSHLFNLEDKTYDDSLINDIYNKISSDIKTLEIAYDFILKELDAASHGNKEAISFVNNSPFTKEEYKGAIVDYKQPVNSFNDPQLVLTNLINQTGFPNSQKTKLRIQIVQKIIDDWYDVASNEEVDLDSLF